MPFFLRISSQGARLAQNAGVPSVVPPARAAGTGHPTEDKIEIGTSRGFDHYR